MHIEWSFKLILTKFAKNYSLRFKNVFINKTPLYIAYKKNNQEINSLLLNDERIRFGDGVLYDCFFLKQVEIPSFITEIGENAFFGCKSLKSIQIPSSVTKIGDFAFKGCESLTQIFIPSSVISIGSNVFENCHLLKEISIPFSLSVGNLGIDEKALKKRAES